jgi:peptidoglycan/LPS O-acetylase OafA/YrhL
MDRAECADRREPARRTARTVAYAFDARANSFDFVRFFLAACVIVSHCFGASGRHDPLRWITRGQVTLGGAAVDAFFTISGFLIARSWETSGNGRVYFLRRARRIYPAFLAAGLFCIVVVGPLTSRAPFADLLPNIGHNLRRLAALGEPVVPHIYQGTLSMGHPNSVVWSIRYEFLCYCLIPVLALAGMFRRPQRMVALVASLYAIHLLWLHFAGISPNGPRVLCYFAVGMAYWVCRRSIPLAPPIAWFATAAVALSFVKGFEYVLPIAGTYLLFMFALRRGPLNQFGVRGDLSYGVYLYGFPMQMLITLAAGGRLGPLPLTLLTLLAATLCAYASWHAIEKRFLRSRIRSHV